MYPVTMTGYFSSHKSVIGVIPYNKYGHHALCFLNIFIGSFEKSSYSCVFQMNKSIYEKAWGAILRSCNFATSYKYLATSCIKSLS